MRRSYPPPVLHVFAAAADTSVGAMSYCPRFHGGRSRGRRSYCDRPQTGGKREFVAGDTHFNENLGFQVGGSSHQSGFQSAPFSPRHASASAYNQNHRFWPPPQDSQRFRPPPRPPQYDQQFFRPHPPFGGNQDFRPRYRKPLDYREWEYARTPPPPNCEKFTVLSYNILADYLATSYRGKLYFHIPRYMMDWEWRKRSLIFELGLWSADILCFQEVDRFHDLEEDLKHWGYSGVWKMRTGNPIDGCAIFWKTSRFKLQHEESIEFNKHGLRDNVAQICVLELNSQGYTESIRALPTSSRGGNKLVVCNIHVLYNPKRGEIKVAQLRLLLDRAHAVSNSWDKAPVVCCGDFNCTPKSALYNYISEQKLDISDVDRDKVSGQASAEICGYRPENPIPCAGSVVSPDQNPPTADDKETSVELSDSITDMKIANDPTSNAGSDSSAKDVSSSQHIKNVNLNDSIMDIKIENDPASNAAKHSSAKEVSSSQDIKNAEDVPGKFCTSGAGIEENNVLHIEATKDPQMNMASNMDESGSTTCVPTCNFEGSTQYCDYEAGFPVHQANEKETLSVNSYPEDAYYGLMEAEEKENRNATPIPVQELMWESSSDIFVESGSMNVGSSPPMSVDGSCSTSARRDLESVDSINTKISSFYPSADVDEVSPAGGSRSLSSQSIVDDETSAAVYSEHDGITCISTSTDSVIGKKMENLSFTEPETGMDGGIIGEDESAFLSALHDSKDPFLSDFGHIERSDTAEWNNLSKEFSPLQLQAANEQVLDDLSNTMDFETVDGEKAPNDPSLWTPAEVETATGNADCTLVEHPLKLKSTYTEVDDSSGTRDSTGEPLVTSYNRRFLGTVDYIWRSEGLQTVRVLAPISKHVMRRTQGFPTKKWGSDHIALVSELAFTKEHGLSRTEG